MCRTNECLFRTVINWCDTFYGSLPTLLVVQLEDGEPVNVPVPTRYCRGCQRSGETDNAALFGAVGGWAQHNFGRAAVRLEIYFAKGRPVQMPVRLPEPPPAFIPGTNQKVMLEAMTGKALRTSQLEAAVGDKRRVFDDPGGIQELIREKLVRHHKRIGYYRVDAPPPELPPPEDDE
jgi:hypothetical protein